MPCLLMFTKLSVENDFQMFVFVTLHYTDNDYFVSTIY